jgi:hypothetical protein
MRCLPKTPVAKRLVLINKPNQFFFAHRPGNLANANATLAAFSVEIQLVVDWHGANSSDAIRQAVRDIR